MGYYEEVLRDKPYSSIRLNSAESAYIDVSGHGLAVTGTTTSAPAIISGTSRAIGASSWSHANALWKNSAESNSFTLEAWYLPLNVTNTVKILGRASTYDGLTANPDFIRFTIPTNLGSYIVSWPIPDAQKVYHVVGVYTPQKIQLYVDHEMVAEQDMPDTFTFVADAGTTFNSGSAQTGTDRFVIDGVNTYAYALSPDRIYAHYVAGKEYIPVDRAVGSLGGTYWNGVNRKTALSREFPTDASWLSGVLTDVGVVSNTVVPLVDQTTLLSKPGEWVTSFEIGATELTSLYGVRIDWDGDGSFFVETSFNGASWNAVTNGRMMISGALFSAVTNPTLLVRIRFVGGVANDTSVVRRLRMVAFSDSTLNSDNSSRVATIGGVTGAYNLSTALEANEPFEKVADSGIDFYGANISIGADASGDPKNVATLELWVRIRSSALTGSGGYLFDTRAGGGTAYSWIPTATNKYTYGGAISTLYVNGVSAASNAVDVKYNEWTHLVYVFSTPLNTPIIVAQGTLDAQASSIATYPTALSAAQALALYQSYSKVPTARIDDPGVINIFEPATPFNPYSYNWSITSGG